LHKPTDSFIFIHASILDLNQRFDKLRDSMLSQIDKQISIDSTNLSCGMGQDFMAGLSQKIGFPDISACFSPRSN
jgi:hypothetical protein